MLHDIAAFMEYRSEQFKSDTLNLEETTQDSGHLWYSHHTIYQNISWVGRDIADEYNFLINHMGSLELLNKYSIYV